MKKLGRRPEQIETLNLFAALDVPVAGQRRALSDPSRVEETIKKLAAGLDDSLGTEARLHGWRADRLFGLIAADLEGCVLVRQEDAGETFYEGDDVKLPDWLLVLRNSDRFLVEVKTVPPTEHWVATFSRRELRRLRRYSDLVGCDLYIATYWTALGLWSLVPADDYADAGNRHEITLEQAMTRDHMGVLLDDRMIGVKPPLQMHIGLSGQVTTSDASTHTVEGTITSVQLLSVGQEMVTDEEKALVWFLLSFADWPTEETVAELGDGEYELAFTMAPEQWDPSQGFALIGRLSQLYSRYFTSATTDDQGIHTLTINAEPGMMPRLIPTTFQSERLPIWHIRVKPPERP
jgi:hypothetical protein